MICHRVEGSFVLGVGIVFSPLHIYYVDNYSCASDVKFNKFSYSFLWYCE
jgi:hypothetical protein